MQALDTSTYNAADRIRQFGDFVGVTDRYTGYRNNLTRGSREPVRMEPKWADKTRRTEYINTLNSGRHWTGELYTCIHRLDLHLLAVLNYGRLR